MKTTRPRSARSSALLLAILSLDSSAATLSWDIVSGNGATLDAGSGNWTLSDATWNDAGNNTVWTQTDGTTATNSAVFGGTDGPAESYAVSIASQVAVQGLTFNSTGYNLSGGPIYVGIAGGNGTHAPIVVSANKSATISSQVIGNVINTSTTAASVTINSGATLTLTGGAEAMRYTFGGNGTLNISGGTYNMTGVYQVNNAVVNHTAGTVNFLGTGLCNFGQSNNVDTLYTLSGSGVITSATTSVVVGRTSAGNATNTFIIKDGGQFLLGNASNSPARLNLTGGVINNSSSNVIFDVQTGGTLSVANTTASNSIAFYPNGAQPGKTLTFKVSGGNASVSGVQFGSSTAGANWSATCNLQVTDGNLYIGSGGISRNSAAAALTVNVQLQGGILGASANWSTPLDIKIGSDATIQAADAVGTARNITLSGVLSDDTTSGAFTKTGSGVLTLSGANTYTGETIVNEGVLVFSRKVARSPASTVTVGANAGIGFGIHESDTTYFSKAEAAAIFNNPSSSGFTLTTGAGIGMDVDSVAVSVDQTEVLSGSSSLVKSGSGTLILSGSNTYTGLTTVSAGDLVVNNANSLGSGAAGAVVLNGARLALSNTTVTGESISITGNGGTGSLGALRGDSGYSKWDGPINISGAATLLDTRIGALSNATLEVAGVIDDGLLDQRLIYRQSDSTSKIIVSGANTYSGPTSVAGGVVEISSFNSVVGGSPSSSLGAPITPENGLVVISFLAVDGHLRYLGSGETTDRTITVGNGTAATNFANATLEHNGTGGALVFSAPVFNIAQVGVTATSPRTLILSGTNSALNTIFGVIQDNLVGASGTAAIALTKQGEGTWILAGANTYSGSTTIGAGTLTLGANGVLPDNSPVSLGAATLRVVTAGVETASTLDVTATGTLQLGTGAQIAFADSSAVDWTGGTLAIAGSFVSGSSVRFGTTSAGLTATQLGLISGSDFTNFALNAEGYLTATSTVLPSYTTWADDPAKGNIPGEPATGDFDADGISNLLEYGLGTNPRVAASLPAALAGNTVAYTKGADAIANGDVSWAIQASQTLAEGSWIDVVSQPAGDTTSTISHLFTPGNPARQFFRLRVTRVE